MFCNDHITVVSGELQLLSHISSEGGFLLDKLETYLETWSPFW